MQNVPKIVSERLKAAASANLRPGAISSPHPDADLLTAFAERSLAEFERGSVLEHLSGCGDCREIVALALRGLEEIAAPVPMRVRTSSRGWLSWPALRWGFVAAGIVAIASLGLLRYQRRLAVAELRKSASVEVAANEPKKQDLDRFVASEPKDKEKLQAPAAPAASDSASAPSAGADSAGYDSAISDSASGGSMRDAKKNALRPEGSAAPTPQVLTPQTKSGTNSVRGRALAANALPHGPRLANQWQQQNIAQNYQTTAPPPPPPSAYPTQAAGGAAATRQAATASETVEVSGAAPVIDTEARKLGASQGKDQSSVDRAKAPLPSVAARSVIPATSGGAGATANQPHPGSRFGSPIGDAAPGRMVGYVVDPSGAVVPNVRITVTPFNSKAATTAVTDSRGAWLIAGLPTGNYKAQAEAPGFKTTVLDLNYDAAQPSLYRFDLDVGNVAETVEVTGENKQVETASANTSSPVNGRAALSPAAIPRWTISATGGLQRSMDQGKTWQPVDVNANPASLAFANNSATSLQIIAKTSRAKASKDKNADKVAKQETAALPFRAVTAAGSEVWAGGSSGALYHSADAGNSWTRVVPTSGGTSITGDVVGIDFPDPQHGKVSTSTSEIWATIDGGLSWRKQ